MCTKKESNVIQACCTEEMWVSQTWAEREGRSRPSRSAARGRCGVASIAENSQRCASQTAVENTAQHRTCRSVHSNFFFFVDGGSVPETEARRILSVMESQSTARRCNRALHARFSGESDGWLKSHAHTLMLRTCQFDFNVRIRVKMCMHGIAAGPEDSQIYELT